MHLFSSLPAHGTGEQPSCSSRCNSRVSGGHGGSRLSRETRLRGAGGLVCHASCLSH